MTGIIKMVIKEGEKQKPRCNACVECPMGVVGCEWDDKPHGHGSGQTCSECGITYYRVHPHSNTCSRATPVTDDVRHDEHNMKRQFRDAEMEEKFKARSKQNKEK